MTDDQKAENYTKAVLEPAGHWPEIVHSKVKIAYLSGVEDKGKEMQGEIERLKVLISKAFDIDYYPNGDIQAAWEKFRQENNLI